MAGRRLTEARLGARTLTGAGVVLLVAGGLLGWLAPRLPGELPILAGAGSPAAASGADVSGYLGADITALAVIVAVVIGFNATVLQIAGQAHSLGLVRGILHSLTPFLTCWSVTTGVALTYLLSVLAVPVGQLWQTLCWFAAVVLLMVAYLWDLPWRLSGQYVSRWALRGLRRQPLATWDATEGYAVLQSSVAAASARGDTATVAAITHELGSYLVSCVDARAESENGYNRARYRALKDLLSGCAQNAGTAPHAVAYNIGWLQAGVLLQAAAIGHPLDDPERNLFSGLVRALRTTPERFDPLWTGLRHALCRADDGRPYLLRYWVGRTRWPIDDPRRVARVAEGLAAFHHQVWRELRAAWPRERADEEAVEMLVDLYRYIAVYLGKSLARERHAPRGWRLSDPPRMLLDTVHALALAQWPEGEAATARVALVNAYEQRRAELGAAAPA
jgi:hypothetical protein